MHLAYTWLAVEMESSALSLKTLCFPSCLRVQIAEKRQVSRDAWNRHERSFKSRIGLQETVALPLQIEQMKVVL